MAQNIFHRSAQNSSYRNGVNQYKILPEIHTVIKLVGKFVIICVTINKGPLYKDNLDDSS